MMFVWEKAWTEKVEDEVGVCYGCEIALLFFLLILLLLLFQTKVLSIEKR